MKKYIQNSHLKKIYQEIKFEKYAGDVNYINKQAVRDGNVITANGTSPLEFCREVLYVLEADTPEIIEESYQYYKNGLSPK